MKNADEMLREIIGIVDANGDGKIQFEGGRKEKQGRACDDPMSWETWVSRGV